MVNEYLQILAARQRLLEYTAEADRTRLVRTVRNEAGQPRRRGFDFAMLYASVRRWHRSRIA